jgi:prepilin-type N-terminal cleavage/methylation domain-containing protein
MNEHAFLLGIQSINSQDRHNYCQSNGIGGNSHGKSKINRRAVKTPICAMKPNGQSIRRGFTLLELSIVIAVVAILLSLLAGPIAKGVKRAKRISAEADQGQTNLIKEQEPGGPLSAE